jgi:hypothetical protein
MVPTMRLFLTGAFLADINRTNPLGMKGELAEGFAGLMALLWHVSVTVSIQGPAASFGHKCFCPQPTYSLSVNMSWVQLHERGQHAAWQSRSCMPVAKQMPYALIQSLHGDMRYPSLYLTPQGDTSSVAPRRFKERIARFAPQFSGYAQHDSQVSGCVQRGICREGWGRGHEAGTCCQQGGRLGTTHQNHLRFAVVQVMLSAA